MGTVAVCYHDLIAVLYEVGYGHRCLPHVLVLGFEGSLLASLKEGIAAKGYDYETPFIGQENITVGQALSV